MSLAPGARVGPYEVVGLLGSGGMGEVHRARDLRLGREVALKVLPDQLLCDAEARLRFEREARAVAALSHPNILAIHDFGSDGDVWYAATELLEGETLRARLSRGALPCRKAVEIGAALADGLAAAHAKGIVHRDLKPENVFVTSDGRAKILDFGLARVQAFRLSGPADMATGSIPPGTEPGTILGTVSYMAPEQVRGETADARSDIFALGCVLHEMLSGRRAFTRPTAAETMAAILNDDPPECADSGRGVSPDLSRLAARCLEKNPDERFQSARDLGFALRAGAAVPTPPPAISGRPRRHLVAAGGAAALALALGFSTGWLSRPPSRLADPSAVFPLTSGPRDFGPAISPDGKFVAYLSESGGRTDLWVKFIGGGPPVNLTARSDLEMHSNTAGGVPDISPDGTSILVRAGTAGTPLTDGSLWLVPAPLGGPPRKLVDRAAGGRWSPDGERIAYIRTNPVGGDAIAVARSDGQDERVLLKEGGGVHLHQPAWSPDGSWIYYIRSINANNQAPTEIWRVPAGGGPPEAVVPTAGSGIAVYPMPTADGLGLLYAGDRLGERLNLWLRSLGSGEQRRLTVGSGEYVEPRISRGGRLVCTARMSHHSLAQARVAADDQRDPSESALTAPRSGDSEPTIDARGTVVFSSSRNGTRNLWILDRGGAEPRPLTSGLEPDEGPALSPDGSRVAFVSSRGGRRGIWLVSAGGGAPRRLVEATVIDGLSWSPDGRRLVYAATAGGRLSVSVLDVERLAVTPLGVEGRLPAWSKAADVIAYVAADEAGLSVLRFCDGAGRPALQGFSTRIGAADSAAWSHDGSHLAIGSVPGGGGAEIGVLHVASGRFRRLATLSAASRVRGIAWSLDDSAVIFGRVDYDSHILLVDGLAW